VAAAIEWGFAYWSATYFREVVKASTVLATNMAALFWAGMLIGRLAFGGPLRRVDPGRTVTACALSAAGAGVLLACGAGVAVSVAGALILGATLSAVIPALLALAIDAHPESSSAISGVMMFASGGGSLLAPALIGIVAGHSSLAAAIWLLPVLALTLAALHLISNRRPRPDRETSESALSLH
jgi:fucose permease